MDFSRAQAMRAQRQLSAIGEDEIYEHVSSEEESSEEESESSQSALSSPKPKPGGTASKPAAKSLDELDDSSSELLDMNHIPADEDGSASKTPPASTSRPLPAIPRGSGEDAIVDAITSRDVSNTRPQPPDPVAVGMQLERVPSSPSPRGTPGVTLDPHVNSNSSTSARVVVAARGNQSEDVPKFNSEDEEEDEDGMEILHKAAPPRAEEEYDASSDSDEIVSLNQSGGSSRSRNSSLGKLVSKPLPQQLDPDLRRPSAENLARRPTPVFKPGPLLTDSTSNPRERGQRASLHRNPSSGQDDEKRDSRRLSQNPPTRRVPSGPKKGTTTTNARPATRSAQALRTRPLPTAPAAGGGRALNLNLLDDSSDSDEVLSYASMAKRKASGGGGGQRVATSAANAKGWPVAEPVVDRTDPPAPGRAPAVLRRLSSSELVLLSLRSAGSNPSSRPGLGRRRSGSGSGRSRSGSGTRTRAGSGSTTSAHPANNPRVRRQESGRFDATAGFADPDEKKDESS